MNLVNNAAPQRAGYQRPKADGFLNISVVDQNGKVHKLNKGIPLSYDNPLERSLLNAASVNPEITFDLESAIHVSIVDDGVDILFGDMVAEETSTAEVSVEDQIRAEMAQS